MQSGSFVQHRVLDRVSGLKQYSLFISVFDIVYTYVYTIVMKSKTITTRVSKWGNGYGVRVPVAILESLSLTSESEVTITSDDKGITISPKTPSFSDMSLSDFLKDVTPDMLRTEPQDAEPFGKPQGREIW
jgi:antitoxin component of MazEF toxin-antitoxin module